MVYVENAADGFDGQHRHRRPQDEHPAAHVVGCRNNTGSRVRASAATAAPARLDGSVQDTFSV